MHRSNDVSAAQFLSAAGILVACALTVPLLGIVMIPIAALGAVKQAASGRFA